MSKNVTVDGKPFVVPDDATPDEIDQISRPAATPSTPGPSQYMPVPQPPGLGGPSGQSVKIGGHSVPLPAPQPSGASRALDSMAVMTRPGIDPKLEGISQIGSQAASSVAPLAAPAAIMAPMAAVGAAGLGYLGGRGARAMADKLGGGSGAQDLAEDVGSLAGGMAGGKLGGLGSRGGISLAKGTLNVPRESAETALQETKGVRPGAISDSAAQRISKAAKERDFALQNAVRNPRLTPARKVLDLKADQIRAGNDIPTEIAPMRAAITEARPGFTGAVTPDLDELHPEQDPADFLGIRQRFGNNFTKFDYTKPLSNEALKTGNNAYMALTNELHSAAPGSVEPDRVMSDLIPVKQSADTLARRDTGPMDTAVNRLTRPTGGLTPLLFGLHEAGVPGGMGIMAAQEALANPTARMAVARGLYAAGKPMSAVPAALIGSKKKD